MIGPRIHGLPSKNPSSKCGIPLFKLWPEGLQRHFKRMKAMAPVLGFPQQLGGSILLLKTPHPFVTAHRDRAGVGLITQTKEGVKM